ncbi:MAG: hypothetical protein WCT53_01530 [Candidatus Gracilibacteria bacterium]
MPLSRDPNILKIPAFMRTRKIQTVKAKRPLVLTALDRKNAGIPAPGLSKTPRTTAQIVRDAYAQSALEFEKSKPQPQRRKSLVATLTERRLTEVIGERSREARAIRTEKKPRPLPKINVQNAFSSSPRITKISQPTFDEPIIEQEASSRLMPMEEEEIIEPENTFDAPLIDDEPLPKTRTLRKKATSVKTKIIGSVTHYFEKIHVGVISLSGILSVGDCITYETADGESYEQVVDSMEIDREPVFKAGKGSEIGIKLNAIPRIGCEVIR